jgi:hypothetical protein
LSATGFAARQTATLPAHRRIRLALDARTRGGPWF